MVHGVTLEAFKRLPKLLRAYAKFVAFAIRQKPNQNSAEEDLVFILIDNVTRSTGRQHYSQISKLLEALCREQKRRSPYNPRTLQGLYKRTRAHRRPVIVSPNDLK